MATLVNINTTGDSDIAAFITNVATTVTGLKETSTKITITAANGDKIVLIGTGLLFDAQHHVIGGTITSMTLQSGGANYATSSGYSIDAATAAADILGGDISGFLAMLGDISFFGNAGADQVYGAIGNDSLDGREGNDHLFGFSGNDTLTGGIGSDTLDGGSGSDTASYLHSAAGVTVNLTTGAASGGDAGGDTFISIENLIGSTQGDVLTGKAGANTILGGLGDDTINGGAGGDSLDGGTGAHDTLSYLGSKVGVVVDLGLNTATGGWATNDTISGFENLIGSNAADNLTGSTWDNVLNGMGGNDTISGGVGSDSLIGGGGGDTLDGGSEDDTLDGGAGNDRLIGGTGVDSLTGGAGADTFVFMKSANNHDIVSDFTHGVDHLEFSAALFGGGLVGGVALTAAQLEINTTGVATTTDARFIYDSATGELYFDSNGSLSGGSQLVAVLQGNPTIDISDFVIV